MNAADILLFIVQGLMGSAIYLWGRRDGVKEERFLAAVRKEATR